MARRKKTVRKSFRRSVNRRRNTVRRKNKRPAGTRNTVQTIRLELVQQPGIGMDASMAFQKAMPDAKRRRF